MSGSVVGAAGAWHAVARTGAAPAAADRLAELAGRVEGPLVAARAAHARALAADDADGLRAAGDAFGSCGGLLLAVAAAAGASNREIAERHGVSVRTVESHLQHAYGKLGVANRRELGAALLARS